MVYYIVHQDWTSPYIYIYRTKVDFRKKKKMTQDVIYGEKKKYNLS